MIFVLLLACADPATDTGTSAGGCLDPANCDGDSIAAPWDCDDTDPDPAVSLPVAYYADADGDGYGSYPGQGSCQWPGSGWVDQGGDCDDTDPEIWLWPCD